MSTEHLPLRIVRPVAENTMRELDTHRGEHPDSYWVALLATSLRQMLDATAEGGEPR